ncbi:hypothetical protein [Streptomyces rapamycinicus]
MHQARESAQLGDRLVKGVLHYLAVGERGADGREEGEPFIAP